MKMSVQGWANLIVVPQGSMLTTKQRREIYNEFQVEVHVRCMRASQAAELGVDQRCKILSMFGLSDNFDAAYAKAMQFIESNGALGVHGLPLGGAIRDAHCLSQPLLRTTPATFALDDDGMDNTGNVALEPGDEPTEVVANSRAGQTPP